MAKKPPLKTIKIWIIVHHRRHGEDLFPVRSEQEPKNPESYLEDFEDDWEDEWVEVRGPFEV